MTRSTVNLDLHCHWLALELYNLFNMNIEEKEEIDVEIDNFTETIQSSSLSKMVSAFQKIAKSYKSRGGEVQWEQILTAQIAREFDRYLFTDDDEAGFYHQLPYHGNLEKGDGMVVPHVDGIVDFKKSILVYDFKTTDLSAARTESIAYISRMLKCHTDNTFPVYLALFPTCSDIIFAFVLNLPKRMGFAEICRVNIDDDTNMKKLFVSLHAGINYLLHHPISYTVPMIEPKLGLQFTVSESLCRTKRESYRVFHHGEHVYKLFDTQSCVKPNREVLGMVEYFEDLSSEPLSNDERFQYLKYKYIHGDCNTHTYTKKMFLSIANTLKILHNHNLVHSDVRFSNMVFDSDKGYLIDFDLTDKVGSLYPGGYNSIEERHKGARANKERKFEHDTFSLCAVISRLLNITINDTENLEEVIQVLNEE